MKNLVVITFKTLQHANEGLNQLKDLDQLGDIVIYNQALIHKKEQDKYEILYHDGPDTEDFPAEGALVGSAIGLIGGPIGVAVGMVTGATAGALDEDDSEDFHDEVLHKVSTRLQPGDYAVICELEEDDSFVVDSYISRYDGVLVRTSVSDAYEKYDREQWDEMNKEIDDEEKQLKAARDEDKAAIKARLDKLKAKREERIKKFKARREKTKKLIHDKIENLNKKIASANEKMKAKMKAQRDKLKERLDKWDDEIAWAYMV